MSDIFHLDFETYSAADLRSFGGYRYAADETTEILIMAIAKNDEPPLVWSVLDPSRGAIGLLGEAVESNSPIYAHNAQFEAAICKYVLTATTGNKAPDLKQWRCTAAMARRAAIPSSLAGAGEFLDIEKAKDDSGKGLIRKFSIPRKPTKNDPRTRVMPEDEPEEFESFVEYCRQDVEAEREIHKRLQAFELEGPVLDSFQFDLAMNDRGVPVNVPALAKVDEMIDEYTERLTKEFREITGLNPTQRAKVLEWVQERGFPFDNLQSAQVDLVLENGPGQMTPEAFKALAIRSNVSYAAVKKVPTMLGAACPDGMVRGSLMWSGAERTHRWSGRIIQPQNFRRPTIKGTEQAYKMLCEGTDIDTIEMLFGPFLEVVASSIRHFIHWPGGKLNQADFSSVEARGAAWLCGGKKKLGMFRNDEPIYETQAANIFGVTVAHVIARNKAGDSEMRFIGKQAELGCTYQMGRPKFRGTCENFKYQPSQAMVDAFKIRRNNTFAGRVLAKAQKIRQNFQGHFDGPKSGISMPTSYDISHFMTLAMKELGTAYRKDGTSRMLADPWNPTPQEWADLTFDDLADRAVTTWRQDNPEIVAAWKSLDVAAKDAIRHPGKTFKGTEKISFGVTNKPGFRALVLKLPSGHTLIYPKAKLVWKGDPPKEGESIDWSDNYNTEIQFWGKIPMAQKWGWCKTYGGKLLENATQGICGDFMANGAVEAARHGYEAFMLVHDELIGPQHPGQDHETLCKHLCSLPAWAEGMPLGAEGATISFYKK